MKEKKRIANKRHRKKIEDGIHSSLTELDGIDADRADNIVVALKENKIPYVSINY